MPMTTSALRSSALRDNLPPQEFWALYAALRSIYSDLPEIDAGSDQGISISVRSDVVSRWHHPEVGAVLMLSIACYLSVVFFLELSLCFYTHGAAVSNAMAAAGWITTTIPAGIRWSVVGGVAVSVLLFQIDRRLNRGSGGRLVDWGTISSRVVFWCLAWALAALVWTEVSPVVAEYLPDFVGTVGWTLVAIPPVLLIGALAAMGALLIAFAPVNHFAEKLNTSAPTDVLIPVVRALSLCHFAAPSLLRDRQAVEKLFELLADASLSLGRLRITAGPIAVLDYSRQRLQRVALSLDEMFVWVLFAKSDTEDHLRHRLHLFARALALGTLDELPESDGRWKIAQQAATVSDRWRRMVATLALGLFVGLPALGAVGLEYAGVDVSPLQTTGWGIVLYLAWVAVGVLCFGDDIGSELKPLVLEIIKSRATK